MTAGSVDRWFLTPACKPGQGDLSCDNIDILHPNIYIHAISDSFHHIDSRAVRNGCSVTMSELIDELVVGHAAPDAMGTWLLFVNLVHLY